MLGNYKLRQVRDPRVSVPGYAGSLSASIPGGGGAAWERLGIELVLSGLVAGAYFAAMERRWTGAAPALIGAAYCAASLVSMPSLNPARSLGPSFVLSRWESHWVSWVGGIGGGLACGLLHEWGSRRRSGSNSRASSPRDLDELDKPSFPTHYRHAPTYCSAAAPRPDNTEPLYSGTKSLYCRSPPPTRHTLHRSQSVYSKGSSTTTGGPLISAQSLLLRPPVGGQHALTHNQNTHNAQRDPAYGTAGTVRPGPAGAYETNSQDSSSTTGRPLISTKSLILTPPTCGQQPVKPQRDLYGTTGTVRPGPASAYATNSQDSWTPSDGSLMSAQSMLLRTPACTQFNQNTVNAQREPTYGTSVRTAPAGAPMQERRDSVYSGSTRRGPLSSDDSAYGTYTRAPYRGQATPAHVAHAAHPMPPDHY
ncbi:hypothetical protein O0L34_g9813 [Tuta absoluta]|nr:hypothetical protein O0L34_g9813 [Tuta absoluta]